MPGGAAMLDGSTATSQPVAPEGKVSEKERRGQSQGARALNLGS